MSIKASDFPASVWDGLSDNPYRKSRHDNEPPDYRDWDTIVAELISTQSTLILPAFVQTAATTVVNTAALTSIIGTGIGSVTIPARNLFPGKTYRIRALGGFNSIATPGTINLQLYANAVRLATTSAVTMTASQTNRYWDAEFTVTFRSIGASASVIGTGKANFNQTSGLDTSPGPVTLDTTAGVTFDLKVLFNTADPGNALITQILTIEVPN